MGNEFHKTGIHIDKPYHYKDGAKVANTIKIIEHESNAFVTNPDGTGDHSISKARFVDAIKEEKEGFKDISFIEFEKIFSVLDKICQDFQMNK